MTNPLLEFTGLPRFNEIKPNHISPAITQLLDECRSTVSQIRESELIPTWENFVQPVVDITERLSRAWGQVSHLNAVMNNPRITRYIQCQLAIGDAVLR